MKERRQKIHSWPDFGGGGHKLHRLAARNSVFLALHENREFVLDVIDKATLGMLVDCDTLNRLRELLKMDKSSMVAGDEEEVE